MDGVDRKRKSKETDSQRKNGGGTTYRKYNVVYTPGKINWRIRGTGNATGLQLVPVIDVPFIILTGRHPVYINLGLRLGHDSDLHLRRLGQRVKERRVRRHLALIKARVVSRQRPDGHVVRVRFSHLQRGARKAH